MALLCRRKEGCVSREKTYDVVLYRYLGHNIEMNPY